MSVGKAESATSAAGTQETLETLEIDLRKPHVAALLAWLIPGAGHFYQGRTAKGVLFMTCILGTFFFGIYLGSSRAVYASMRPQDRRFHYFSQIGVGLAAMPALVQAYRMGDNARPQAPLWNGFMAPPRLPGQVVPKGSIDEQFADPISQRAGYVRNMRNESHVWRTELHRYLDLGIVYTMIAGLLNVLAIYDAWAGPLLVIPAVVKKEDPPPDEHNNGDAS